MDLVVFRGKKVAAQIAPKLRKWLAGHDDTTVTSGYRSKRHNAAIGGSPRSYHLVGRAVDVVGPSKVLDHLEATAGSHGAHEVLRESDHLHVAF